MLYKTFDQLNGKKLKKTDQVELYGRVFLVEDLMEGGSNANWFDLEEFLMKTGEKEFYILTTIERIPHQRYMSTTLEVEQFILGLFALIEKINVEILIDKKWITIPGDPIIINLGEELDAYIVGNTIIFRDDEDIHLTTTIDKIKKILPGILELPQDPDKELYIEDYGDSIYRQNSGNFGIGCKDISFEQVKNLQKVLSKL